MDKKQPKNFGRGLPPPSDPPTHHAKNITHSQQFYANQKAGIFRLCSSEMKLLSQTTCHSILLLKMTQHHHERIEVSYPMVIVQQI